MNNFAHYAVLSKNTYVVYYKLSITYLVNDGVLESGDINHPNRPKSLDNIT